MKKISEPNLGSLCYEGTSFGLLCAVSDAGTDILERFQLTMCVSMRCATYC